MLDRFYRHVTGRPDRSDIVSQLRYVAAHYRHPMLVVVVSDEPDVDDRLAEVVGRVAARHEVLWAMVSDMPAVSGDVDGYDVASGRFVPGGARLGPRLARPIAAPSSSAGSDSRRSSPGTPSRSPPSAAATGFAPGWWPWRRCTPVPGDLLRYVGGPGPYSSWWLWLGLALLAVVIAWYAAVFVATMPGSRLRRIRVLRDVHGRLLRRRFAGTIRRITDGRRRGELSDAQAYAR